MCEMRQAAEAAVMRLGPDASLLAVERVVEEGLIRECRAYNQRKPLITVIAHDMNNRAAPAAYAEAVHRANARMAQSEAAVRGRGGGRRGGGSSRGRGGSTTVLPWAHLRLYLLHACSQSADACVMLRSIGRGR